MGKDSGENLRKLFVGIEEKVIINKKDKIVPINFDNAATTPPFKRVLKRIIECSEHYGSIARGDGQNSQFCSETYEDCRRYVLKYFNAPDNRYTALFIGNATEGLNKLANMLIQDKSDIVITTRMEHHSNDLPWRDKCSLKYIDVDGHGRIKLEQLEELLLIYNERVKYVTITGASNVTGYINNIEKISALAHSVGAKLIIDGAQLIPHKKVVMIDGEGNNIIDYLVFSAHKLYAPFGGGAIIGLKDELNKVEPLFKGGGTVKRVMDYDQEYLLCPERNEAGTPNFFGVLAMVEALKELDRIGFDTIERNEKNLYRYLIDGMNSLDKIILYGDNECVDDRLGILGFNILGMSYEAVGAALACKRAIAVRQGGFCAHPYVRRLLCIQDDDLEDFINENGMPGMIRVSLGIYNTKKEVDIFLEIVEEICRGYKGKVYN